MRIAQIKSSCLILLSALFVGCGTGTPDGITPVEDFDLDRYLGQWYEIARLDHRFERGLSNVTARYEPREGGGIEVTNKGYSAEDEEWDTAVGKAYFVGAPQIAHLKVSFFGPFYGSYIVFELDHSDYQYAFITGPNRDYLWFLSRTPTVSEELKNHFVETVDRLGFEIDELIFVAHEAPLTATVDP